MTEDEALARMRQLFPGQGAWVECRPQMFGRPAYLVGVLEHDGGRLHRFHLGAGKTLERAIEAAVRRAEKIEAAGKAPPRRRPQKPGRYPQEELPLDDLPDRAKTGPR